MGARANKRLMNQIDRAKARIDRIDERLGRLHSERVDSEERLAALYEQLRTNEAGTADGK